MKIKQTKSNKYKLTLTYKELSVIENALNYSEIDSYQTEVLNDKLFNNNEFKNSGKLSNFEMKIWIKINKKLKETNVY